MTSAKLNATGLRWIVDLGNYKFFIKHRKGKKLSDLSRNTVQEFLNCEKFNYKLNSNNKVEIILYSTSTACKTYEIETEILELTTESILSKRNFKQLGMYQSKDPTIYLQFLKQPNSI